MKFFDLLRMSVNNLRRRKLRTFLTVLGVVIGTASIVVMISLGLGMNKTNMEQIERYGGLTTINVYSNDGGYYATGYAVAVDSDSSSGSAGSEPVRIDDTVIETLRAIPNVSIVSPVLSMSIVVKQGAYVCDYLTLKAMDVDALNQMNIKVAEGSLPQKGARSLRFSMAIRY